MKALIGAAMGEGLNFGFVCLIDNYDFMFRSIYPYLYHTADIINYAEGMREEDMVLQIPYLFTTPILIYNEEKKLFVDSKISK